MKIQILIGSTRQGRIAERVAKWVATSAMEQPNFEVELVDLADYDMPYFDEPISPRYNPNRQSGVAVKKFLAKVAETDGYVIVTPEYNHSITAVLKNALDNLGFEFAKKPVAIVSYGSVGGARAAEQLKGILIEVKAAIVPEALTIVSPQLIIDENGNYTGDTAKAYGPDKQLVSVLGELSWWTETLKAGRKELAGVK
jgi:NAD(P)H-dependent FMN reductase